MSCHHSGTANSVPGYAQDTEQFYSGGTGGAWELRTKAIPGARISYLSHQRLASDARHSRQGERPVTVWLFLGADLVFSSLDFVAFLFLNRP